MSEVLSPDEVRVVLVDPDGVDEPDLERARAILAEPEREYLERCRHPRRQREFLVARSLLRRTLSRFAPVDPQDWTLTENERGRPERAGPPVGPDLRFNVSHTHGLAAVALTVGREVGVDVEWTERRGRTVELADRWFTPEETSALRALPSEQQRHRFFDLWTLKESYIKARGLGLAIPLQAVSFDPSQDPIGLRLDASLGDRADRWWCALRSPTPFHRLAVSVESPPGAVSIRIERA